MRSRSKSSSRCNSAGEKQPSNPKCKLLNECLGTKVQLPPVTPPPQVIDMGLALAKPRECRDDAGLQVHIVTVLNACKRFSTWAQCVRDCVADSWCRFVQMSRNAFKNWVKQLAIKEHWATSKVIRMLPLIVIMTMTISNVTASHHRTSVMLSSKLVDKTLKLHLKALKGEAPLAAGCSEAAEGSRKRPAGPSEGLTQNKKKKPEQNKDGCSANSNAATVVVDLSYEDLMNDKESASLATQVINSNSHAHNTAARFAMSCFTAATS
jgi:hypothetical protein